MYNLINLKPGTIVRNKNTELTYIVTVNYGNRVTAVRTTDITNPIEWEIINECNEPRKKKYKPV